jgi:hypothetical protein
MNPFNQHLAKSFPHQHDQAVVLSYLAALVQHQGEKFPWALVLSGCEGGGKTMFARCVSRAIGPQHAYSPREAELDRSSRGWLLGRTVIGIEDVAGQDARLEATRGWIGSDTVEVYQIGRRPLRVKMRANFLLTSNSPLSSLSEDPRFEVIHAAQQTPADLARHGMDGKYFSTLYRWLHDGGYEEVAEMLSTCSIPDKYNPVREGAHDVHM